VLADIAQGAAKGDAIDNVILNIMSGPQEASITSKTRSLRAKFIDFAIDTGYWPLFPMPASAYFRYICWLPFNGIQAGWKACTKYLSAAVHWGQEIGGGDMRLNPQFTFLWNKLRHNFKSMIPAIHSGMKQPIRPAQLEALAMDIDINVLEEHQFITICFFLFFLGVRAGHVMASGAPKHCVTYDDIRFEPSVENPQEAFILFKSTKTRPRAADLPFYGCLRAQQGIIFCPLKLLASYWARTYNGIGTDVLFRTPTGSALQRSAFNTNLRARMQHAERHLQGPVFSSTFSAISFRKGSLSALANKVASHVLADHASGCSSYSSRIYTVSTVQDRGDNCDAIASAFCNISN